MAEQPKRNDQYACVYFPHEGSYSCIKSKLIAYDMLEFPNLIDTVGKELPVVWEDSGAEFQAEIIAFGRKRKMNDLAADKAQAAANESFEGKQDQLGRGKRVKRKFMAEINDASINDSVDSSNPLEKKRNRKVKTGTKVEVSRQAEATIRDLVADAVGLNVDPDPQLDMHAPTAQTQDYEIQEVIAEKDKEIKRLQRKLSNMTNRAISTEKMRIGQTQVDKQMITVGGCHKVNVPKGIVECIKDRFRLRPQQFLRAMMEHTGVFKLEEIASSSVYGKKTSTSPLDVRPALGPKFLALKEFTAVECGLVPNSISYIKFEEGTRRICTDARKRLSKQKNNSENDPAIAVPENNF